MTTAGSENIDVKKIQGHINIVRQGEKLIMPEGMTYKEGREWLTRKENEEEMTTKFDYVIDAFPLEGAYALKMVLDSKYGFVENKGLPPSFFEPVTYPTLLGIEVGVNKTEQVPWGGFTIPGISGTIYTGFSFKDNRFQFRMYGEIKNKHKDTINMIVKLVQDRLKTQSVYQGKPIRVNFQDDPEKLDPRDSPKFIDVSKVDPAQLIFSDTLAAIVNTTLFTPIEKTKQCKRYGVPLKRGVLLEGPYGCGKSLTADVVAKKCLENGWTFIQLQNVKQLAQAIEFAKQYQPAVIFAEDIDRAINGSERTTEMDEILNVIDGVGSKSNEIFVMLTTNDVKSINKAMLRPGRLDAVITIAPPDKGAAIRLVHRYAPHLLDETDDFNKVGEMLAGRIPAVIREVVERSKLAAISRIRDDERLLLKAQDIELASETMIRHLELLRETEVDGRSNMEKAGSIIADALRDKKMLEQLQASGQLVSNPVPNGSHSKDAGSSAGAGS